MHNFIAAVVLAHGLAHLVGFAGNWGLIQQPELGGATLVGGIQPSEAAQRALGIVWLLLALGFAAVAVGLFLRREWTANAAIGLAFGSLVFCLLAWPAARIGVAVNLLTIAAIAVGRAQGWL